MTINVVRGDPSAEELAAVVTVLLSATVTADPARDRPQTSAWAAPHRVLRTAHAYGRVGWRASSFPR
ncbi:acyl-CoA carboxylase epsilon subunit-like protein [Krasilnikovia cinnamomea]|uniref:Acyl-CoA carboxylase epsilon subunit-like protein n=1 Tax=Krasilnikovia cinnamomea TaxID=349313 RepID=A0A4Q7ZRG4_9ACTN|nr:acyl-CoA carboxylase subunit epsilon [Krasilnikovia cinnamomea]RZU53730.1 acyl-CoA carboxylase epsilon subunit-like protein [Krasilnikovia cinnamomea]